MDGWIRIHDRESGRVLRILLKVLGYLHCLAWSPDGNYLAATRATTVQVWDPETGRLYREYPRSGVGYRTPLAWSPDSGTLAIVDDRELRLMTLTTDQVRHSPLRNETTWDIAWSPDGKWLATGGSDTGIFIYDAATGNVVHEWKGAGSVRRLAWAPDSESLVTWTIDKGLLRFVDRANGKMTVSVQLPPFDGGLNWNPKVNLIAVAGPDCQIVDPKTANDGRMIHFGELARELHMILSAG